MPNELIDEDEHELNQHLHELRSLFSFHLSFLLQKADG